MDARQGRAGDSNVEWVTLEILLEETVGDPLTDTEANDLIHSVSVHLDDGSATFDPGSDILVTIVSGLTPSAGVATIAFTDDDPNVQVPFGAPETYFVAVQMTSDASAQTPNSFQGTHLVEASSTGEDAVHDLPLTLELGVNSTTGVIDTVLSTASCTAPFDLNLSNITVSTSLVCEAGTVIRTGTAVAVASPAGDMTFRAGQSVELRDGFDVEANASFTAEIDPGLQPQEALRVE